MTPRSTVILSLTAGFFAGASLVGGLAFQPGRGQAERPEGDRPPEGQPEDRARPARGRDNQPGGKGRPALDPERLTRRLEEVARRLDSERELVGKVLAALKEGKKPEELEPQIREAMMLAGGRPANDGPGPDRPPNVKGSPEEHQELVNAIREIDPGLAERMEEFQKKRPILGRAILANVAPRPGEVLRAKAESPELFDIFHKQIACGLDIADHAFELGELLRGAPADAEAVKAKRTDLREAVGRNIDLRAQLQERDLESLVKRVDDLRGRVQAAVGDREKNIDVFIARITRILEDARRRGGKPGENGDGPPPEGRRPNKDGPRPNGPPPGNPPPNDRPR